MECLRCEKELFLSLYLAQNAATIYQWFYGKKYAPYRCPYRHSDYHLTTDRSTVRKWSKRSTEASKSK